MNYERWDKSGGKGVLEIQWVIVRGVKGSWSVVEKYSVSATRTTWEMGTSWAKQKASSCSISSGVRLTERCVGLLMVHLRDDDRLQVRKEESEPADICSNKEEVKGVKGSVLDVGFGHLVVYIGVPLLIACVQPCSEVGNREYSRTLLGKEDSVIDVGGKVYVLDRCVVISQGDRELKECIGDKGVVWFIGYLVGILNEYDNPVGSVLG